MTAFLERPWVRDLTKSRYMVHLLKFLQVGRRLSTIRSKFYNIPEGYLLGALEALERLGVINTIEAGTEKVYVLTDAGKAIVSFLDSLSL